MILPPTERELAVQYTSTRRLGMSIYIKFKQYICKHEGVGVKICTLLSSCQRREGRRVGS
jgi:hypothetical protein